MSASFHSQSIVFRRAFAFAVASLVALPAHADASKPELSFTGGGTSSRLAPAYDLALTNLIDLNTASYDTSHDQTGLIVAPAQIISPGTGYAGQIWTRDAAVNSIAAGSLLEPVIAENTLLSACTKQSNGKLIVQQDDQFWDRAIWVTGAYQHYLVTGDKAFLAKAYEAGTETLHAAEKTYQDAVFGLFRGPSHINDGISGYPAPPATNPETGSGSFEYSAVLAILTLSSNVVHYRAYLDLAAMANELGAPASDAAEWNGKAAALKTAINAHLWRADAGTFGYFLHGAGAARGTLDPSQEALGLSLAILDGLTSADQTAQIIQHAAVAPRGMPDIYPSFARYDNAHPCRHNVSVWPYIQSVWATAMASVGNEHAFAGETEHLAALVTSPTQKGDQQFYEIYHFQTGLHDGGWQTGGSWGSATNQTWSATGFLRMIHAGLFGVRFRSDGIAFAPVLPDGWGNAALKGLRYRGMTLDISLTGAGTTIGAFTLDGAPAADAFVPASLTGAHHVEIALTNALVNVARSATVTSSDTASDYPGTLGANDGEVNGYLDTGTAADATFHGNPSGLNLGAERSMEWVAAPHADKPWLRFTWPSPVNVEKIRLFDRINGTDQVTSGTLDFSDGSSLPVGSLQNDGFTPAELSFTPKSVTWARFTIDSVSASTYEPGLAEVEIYARAATSDAPGTAGAAGIAGSSASNGGTTSTGGTAPNGGTSGKPAAGGQAGMLSIGGSPSTPEGGASGTASSAMSSAHSGCSCRSAGSSPRNGVIFGYFALGACFAGRVRRRIRRVPRTA